MGGCISKCSKAVPHEPSSRKPHGQEGREAKEHERRSNGTTIAENGALNSHMATQLSQTRRLPSRISSTLSALSFKSARSHFDDDTVSSRENSWLQENALSADGGRWRRISGDVDSDTPRGGSPGSISPSGGSPRANGVASAALRSAWTEKNKSGKSKRHSRGSTRSSLGGLSTFSSILSSSPKSPAVPEVAPHEVDVSPYHVDPTEYDKAYLAMNNALFGHNVSSLVDIPVLPVAPWNRKPGYLGHLTEEQQAKLEALQVAFPESAKFHTSHDMLRFLRARSFDLGAARLMYQKFVSVYREQLMISPAPAVRENHGAWPLHHVELFPQRPEECTQQIQHALRCFLHVMVFRTDRQGRPAVYLRVTDMVKHNMLAHVPLPDRLCIQSSANELNRLLCLMASAKVGYHVEEVFQVMDVGGISIVNMIKHIRSTDNQAELTHNSDYVPETLGKVVIVNAPFGAGKVWQLAQVFIPPATRDKISICATDHKAELLKYVDADDLPSCYGGNAPFEWPEHDKPKDVYK